MIKLKRGGVIVRVQHQDTGENGGNRRDNAVSGDLSSLIRVGAFKNRGLGRN